MSKEVSYKIKYTNIKTLHLHISFVGQSLAAFVQLQQSPFTKVVHMKMDGIRHIPKADQKCLMLYRAHARDEESSNLPIKNPKVIMYIMDNSSFFIERLISGISHMIRP